MNVFILLVVLLVIAAVLRRRGSYGYAAVAALLAAFPALTLARQVPWWGWLLLALVATLVGWQWAARVRGRGHALVGSYSSQVRGRLDDRSVAACVAAGDP